jgi:GT2 family glycosyltransferase
VLRVLMLAHNSAAATRAAIKCVVPQLPEGAALLVLDNGSQPALDRGSLGIGGDPRLRLSRSERNLGFAEGMNRLIGEALADAGVSRLLLLNNDAEMLPGSLAAMLEAVHRHGESTLLGARMMQMGSLQRIDSLGIALFRSGLASNRRRESIRLLGPTGGCMLLPRTVLDTLLARHGHWFDPAFFCYAEDTDLVMRSRWLGFPVAIVDEATVLHHGSLSSGGADNEFVLYHGIRNSIWTLAKNAPALWLLAFSPWLLLAHTGIWVRNLRKGRARTLWRLYRDALAGLPAMIKARRRIAGSRVLPARTWWSWVEPRLYDPDYLRMAWSELFRRGRR